MHPIARAVAGAVVAIVAAIPVWTAAAQQAQTIPIRPLGPIVAKTIEPFGVVSGVRGVAGGKVFVNDPEKRRFWQLDSTMTKVMAVADTAGTLTIYNQRGAGIVKYLGDSTLYIDVASQSMLVLDASGAVTRVMAPPKARDIAGLISGSNGPIGPGLGNQMPGIDARGRLVYRGVYAVSFKAPVPGEPQVQAQPDSAPLVRGDFETRAIDTLAAIRIPSIGTQIMTQSGPTIKMKAIINPLQVNDDWTVLSDGTVAIVRSQDYHIDWIDPDGHQRSTAKMPFDWRRLTDEEKQFYSDSALKWLQNLFDSVTKAQPPGQKLPFVPELTTAPLKQIPDFLSPVASVCPDLDGNIWILPVTSLQAKNGKLYDVVNRKGEITERVQFPPGRALAGFGPGGTVYLSLKEGGQTYLERARLR